MTLFQTNAHIFWDKTKDFYKHKITTFAFGLIFIRNYSSASSELGLEFLDIAGDKMGIISSSDNIRFEVIDQQRFLLAKVKYGI